MCLIIPDGESIKTAKKSITVYKRVDKRTKFWIPYHIIGGTFKYNEILTALSYGTPIEHLSIRRSGFNIRCIDAGFHCVTTDSPKWYLCPNVICIIPKGAEYCKGDEDIVSTKLIVFKHKWNYLWYKLWHR